VSGRDDETPEHDDAYRYEHASHATPPHDAVLGDRVFLAG
jgi:hypothetical protein